jgi:citrate lyase subunit beta/citryl-CoA lyase
MLSRALTRRADAVIVDLEDGVPRAVKDTARKVASAWIDQNSGATAQVWVRLNPCRDLLEQDLDAVVSRGLTGVYVPKVSSAVGVERVSEMIGTLERARGLEFGAVRIVPLLETARSILEIPAIAGAPRVAHMALGETDLAADLGMHPSPDGHEMDPMRISIVVASAAEGLNSPIGPVQTAFRDLEALRETSLKLRRMGYGGRAAIHPAQVPVINEAFAPTEDEILTARDVLERFESARSGGAAVTVAEDGSLIDEAVVRRARVTIGALRRDQEREL